MTTDQVHRSSCRTSGDGGGEGSNSREARVQKPAPCNATQPPLNHILVPSGDKLISYGTHAEHFRIQLFHDSSGLSASLATLNGSGT